jgi:hypothetical protein
MYSQPAQAEFKVLATTGFTLVTEFRGNPPGVALDCVMNKKARVVHELPDLQSEGIPV